MMSCDKEFIIWIQHNRLFSLNDSRIKHVENYLFFLKFLIRNERENIVDDKFLVSCKLYPSHTVPFQIYFWASNDDIMLLSETLYQSNFIDWNSLVRLNKKAVADIKSNW